MSKKKSRVEMLPTLARLVKAFWPQIASRQRLLWLSAFSLAAAIFLHVLEPWPLRFIYNIIFRAASHRAVHPLPFLHSTDLKTQLGLMAAALILVAGLGSIADYLSPVMMAYAASDILADVRASLFAHLQNLSLAFHFRKRSGDLITRVTGDVDRMREVLVTAALPLLTNSLTVVAMLGVMFWMNWRLALITAVAFPFFVAFITRLTRSMKQAARSQRQREGVVAAATTEALTAVQVVQAFSLQNLFYNLFKDENEKSFEEAARVQKISANLGRTTDLLITGVTGLILWVGAQSVISHQLTPGDLIVFVNYLRKAFRPMRQLARNLGQIAKALASGDRVLEVLETKTEIVDNENAVDAAGIKGHLRFEKVSFGYGPEKNVLQDIDFELPAGKRMAIVGPSGSGKSTLASLLMRFYDPTEGRILLDGRDLRDYKVDTLRSQVGMVFQESLLFSTSVQNNISYGALNAGEDQVINAAKLANAHEFITELPQSYDTVLGERGATLSGGQRQRVAIARAAIRQTPILILDEPTASLDGKSDNEVSAALERLTEGRTTVWITHDLRPTQHTDMVLYIEHGKILEQGTHEELMARGGRYNALYEAGMANYDSLYAVQA